VTAEVHFRFANRWVPVSSPSMTISIGKTSTFEMRGSGRTDEPTGRPFKLKMTVSDYSPTLWQLSAFEQMPVR